jgi:hypothetical protein
MGRDASLFSRRVPLRIWLPIVLACAAAGFIASIFRPIPSSPHIPRSERPGDSPITVLSAEHKSWVVGDLLSSTTSEQRDKTPITLHADKVHAPIRARSAGARYERAPVDVEVPAVAKKGAAPRPRTARIGHSVAKPRPPKRTAQQAAKAPSTSSVGLKSIPFIGPVFSLLQ